MMTALGAFASMMVPRRISATTHIIHVDSTLTSSTLIAHVYSSHDTSIECSQLAQLRWFR